jgi:hypothetical protein
VAAAAGALAAALTWVAAGAASPQQSQGPSSQTRPAPPKTTLQSIYTAAQAKNGETTYNTLCVSCHPRGTYSGVSFRQHWQGKPLLELYEWVLYEMPKSDPGSLTPAQSIQVVAFILQENKMPVGKTPLTTDVNALGAIRIQLK